jgi:hypothetical protein
VKSKLVWHGTLVICLATLALAEPAKESPGEMVDSGAFGVFMNGHRVATETFSIRQGSSGSVANSEFRTEQATDKSVQSSELQLTAGGDIRRYEWKEVSPGKAQAVVTPNEGFLIERSTGNPQEKPEEHPFLMPVSTSVLDDYFFVHREILAWRYLAMTCKQEKGQVLCPPNQRTQFGALNPHARSSMQVTLEFLGREKITIRGVEQELNRVNLKGDSGDWAMWLDDKFKLQRIVIASDNTEVVRD